ncbi:MAG: carbohydrate kinase [Bryobacteraceae bacterium]|nr:carbohydrate kinase [Bryobacteraceae bacterium]
MNIVSIGEILWDVFPDAEKLGGATFNFSVHASRLGHIPYFVSAVGDDGRGRRARKIAADLGLPIDFLQVRPGVATGTVDVKVDTNGQPDFTLHRPAAYDHLELTSEVLNRLAALQPQWLYFGTLHQILPGPKEQTRILLSRLPEAKRFYDVNLRRDCYTPELLLQLLESADVVKLNEDEAREIDAMNGRSWRSPSAFTAYWSDRFQWHAIAITRGAEGCALRVAGEYAEVPGVVVRVADTVGAGDAFSAAFVHGLSQSWDPKRIGDFANRVGALVASRPGGIPQWSASEISGTDSPALNGPAATAGVG